MAEVTNELIYEVLRSMQERLSRLENGQTEIKSELNAMRGHMLATQQDVANIYITLVRHETRLDRIDRRLELREPEPA